MGTTYGALCLDRLLTKFHQNGALVSIDGMVLTPKQALSNFYQQSALTEKAVIKAYASKFWRACGCRNDETFGGPLVLFLFSVQMSAGYGKPMDLTLEELNDQPNDRELSEYWMEKARGAGLISKDMPFDAMWTELSRIQSYFDTLKEAMPDRRFGFPCILFESVGILTNDASWKENPKIFFDRKAHLERFVTRGPVKVVPIHEANHLQILYDPHYHKISQGIAEFMKETKLDEIPPEEVKRHDRKEY